MALGAARRSVVAMVLREALLLVVIGLAIGVPAAFLLGRFAVEPGRRPVVRADVDGSVDDGGAPRPS